MKTDNLVIDSCAHCGTRNRMPENKLASGPKCGKCGQRVFPDHPQMGTDVNFSQRVEASALPVLVDFWAPWCAPCRMLAPVLDEVAHERQHQLRVVKVNVDENPQLAQRFAIRSIPTLMLFRHGKLVDTMQGAASKQALLAQVDAASRA